MLVLWLCEVLDMQKLARNVSEYRLGYWILVAILSAALGVPLSISWLLEAGNDPGKIAIGLSPFLGCSVIGLSVFGFIHWVGSWSKE